MTHCTWQQRNEDYLAARLSWLRARLERLTDSFCADTEQAANTTEPASPPSDADEGFDEGLPHDASTLPALEFLRQRLGLSAYERDFLFLCAAMELDTHMPSLCARAHDDANKSFPTFGLCMTLFADAAWDVMSPERPLRKYRLLEVHQRSDTPLVSSCLRIDERIACYVKGLNYLDDRLAALTLPLDDASRKLELPASQQSVADSVIESLIQTSGSSQLPVVQLLGTDPASKQQVACAIAAEFGLQLYRLPAELIPADLQEQVTLARLWERECLLLPIALYVEADDLTRSVDTDNQTSPLVRFLSRINGLVFLDTVQVRHQTGRATEIVDVDKPAAAEQRQIWKAVLFDDESDLPQRLSSQFSLDTRSIHEIAAKTLKEESRRNNGVSRRESAVWTACRNRTRPRLDALAQRMRLQGDLVRSRPACGTTAIA